MSARHGMRLAVAWMLGATAAIAAPPAVDRQEVVTEVGKLARLLSDGAAEIDPKAVIVTPGSAPYVLALFFEEGFGGGNGGVQYLAVFKRNVQPDYEVVHRVRPLQLLSVVKVGQDFEREFESISVEGKRITLTGKRWQDDAHCCPSHPVTAVFTFDEHSITELDVGKK